ncbi:MAG: DNA repair protein RecN [Deltaproteobacteria bacterium]|nr:DNA repair protein RecN [Deltaproteobacteria bacterium]
MLAHLNISNFAIIKRLEIDFNPGLNIISGETGAGKSIIINAVNLILGGRASSDIIRGGTEEARVEALFNLPDNSPLRGFMDEFGLPFDNEVLIKRTISREGRNRITINGSVATLQMLARLGMFMISISGQHEHQILLRPENHLLLLDEFGGLMQEREALAEAFNEYESVKARLKGLEREIREARERQDLSMFQIREIEAAALVEDEDVMLEDERKRLRYAESLREIINESYQILYEKEDSVLSGVAQCIKNLEKGIEQDRQLRSLSDLLSSAKAELEEAGIELRDFRENITDDPARLEQVEERIQVINRLKRKYGPEIKDVIALKERLNGMIYNREQMEELLKETAKELKRHEEALISMAVNLSEKRKDTANRIEKEVEAELNLLDMKVTRFKAGFRDEVKEGPGMIDSIRPDGFDRVEFLLSANVGEDLRPLSRIASGGELSRIMLALKTILARSSSVETIIFDEIDAGIGGATAETVGEKLRSLSEYNQVLCITHLPQIAGKGDTHFIVKKEVRDNRTQTAITLLSREERVRELARLLGGKVISERAMAHAEEMLKGA